jgi:predicted amidophosphoribosyltransferase
MQNEFYVNKDIIVEGKNILLVDDVVTTGATLSSCAAILKKAGAKSVKAIVFTQKV